MCLAASMSDYLKDQCSAIKKEMRSFRRYSDSQQIDGSLRGCTKIFDREVRFLCLFRRSFRLKKKILRNKVLKSEDLNSISLSISDSLCHLGQVPAFSHAYYLI